MQYKALSALGALAALPLATAKPGAGPFQKRQQVPYDAITWGPLIGMGPTKNGIEITSVLATIYPGTMPSAQKGGLYNWIGLNNATESGDLIQGIVGSYEHGQSECQGSQSNTLWCISAEVYGYDAQTGGQNQYVGTKRTLDSNPAHGVTFNYTLLNKETGLWTQTATDAVTGAVLATYQKESPNQMTMINTAVECQECTPPIDEQYWKNITIILSGADEGLGETLYQSNKATNSKPTTPDGGKTWKIQQVTIPVTAPISES